MDVIRVESNTPKNTDAMVISVLRLLRHKLRHAIIRFDFIVLPS
ncbi:MAG: hypothetical protein U5K79_13235 [Cyclobacteriaceae bacterium]|nr:hypothetical protein [Cyclobacteriaceae bacterium]